MFQPCDDHTGGPPGQHFVKNAFFFFGQVVGNAHNRLQNRILEHLVDTGQNLGKYHVGQRGNDDRNKVHPVRRQRPGDLVRHVA